MKLLMTIVERRDYRVLTRVLLTAGFQVTRLESRGGFLNAKNYTLISAVRDERVQLYVDTVRANVGKRDTLSGVELSHSNIARSSIPPMNTGPTEVLPGEIHCGGATLFVLSMEHLEKI